MAPKKRKKKISLKKHVKLDLIGLLFIFVAIFGSGASAISDGFIPGFLDNIFRFFLGIWYFIASIAFLITGITILVKKRYPNYMHKKMVGFYIAFSGLLLLTHIQTLSKAMAANEDLSILATTWSSFTAYIQGDGSALLTGGGLIGGLLFAITYFLFSSIGAKIVSVFSIFIGLIFITELSVGDIMKRFWKKVIQLKDRIKDRIQERKKVPIKDSHTEEPPQVEEDSPELDYEDTVYSFNEEDKHVEEPKQVEKTEQVEEDIDEISHVENIENVDYKLPPMSVLNEPKSASQQQEKSQVQATVRKLERTFQSFGVKARISKVHVGPAVTKYEVSPEAGVKVSRIVSLHDDLALALAAKDIRIEAPIPGKSAVGIEVPNKEVAMVSLREVIDSTMNNPSKLLFALGRDVSGDSIIGELNKMPHLLIAGATGSGKSVCVNGIITTILMRAKPHEVKMMMIDPKKVELNIYNGIPHLLTPVVTDPKKASRALKKVVAEMERRYELFSETSTRNIEAYNAYIQRTNAAVEEDSDKVEPLPYIVVLVDELADLMMVASGDVEDSITRLAQMARAAGIHLIIATQRPSVDVITGVIKANIPSRIAFSVSSQTDSRTILDAGGAEKLLGRGDMLYLPVGLSKPIRVQGAFLSDEEVEAVISHCISEQEVTYQEEMIPDETNQVHEEVEDELFEDAVALIIEMETASVSMLQRRFRIGYTRAARLIDAMEDRGYVGPYEGNRPREVLITSLGEEETSKETPQT